MTTEQIMQIPILRDKGHTNTEIAMILGTKVPTINYWVKKLKSKGYTFKTAYRGGRKAVEIPTIEIPG